ncbi:MAG TPA: NF038122 family metalloprotease [Verrucomicrobiae bacterium]
MSSNCLTIVPTFDSSISGNSTDGPAMMAAINNAIAVFENDYSDKFTINITFVVDTSVALGESDIEFVSVSYSKFRAALKTRATSANDALALSHLPTTSTDPVVGGAEMMITTPLASLLGLTSRSPNGNTIYFNTNQVNMTRPNPNNDFSDLQSVIEHEMDEVLGGGGAGCTAGESSQIGSLDLFRYATNSTDRTLARTWITNGDNAFFSVDGTNLWARFNMIPGADLGDLWGFAQDQNTFLPLYWSPPGVTPHAEVQDAISTASFFSYPENFEFFPTTNYYYENTSPDLATNEMTMLDIIGWTLSAKATPPPVPIISFVGSGTQLTLSWPTNAIGYSLQQSSSLMPGSWVAAATGAQNPAVISIADSQEFYRLVNTSVTPALVATESPQAESSEEQRVTRRLLRFGRSALQN